jgi:hypothetical protein
MINIDALNFMILRSWKRKIMLSFIWREGLINLRWISRKLITKLQTALVQGYGCHVCLLY